MKQRFVFLLFLLLPAVFVHAQKISWGKSNPWVDSVYKAMTDDERITQLMMVDVWTMRDSSHFRDVECLVKELKVGGLIFFKGYPSKQAMLTNYYQSVSKVPLLVGIDGEWGISMRLDSTPVFPRQMTIGATRDEDLVYEMGKVVGKQCNRMGIHFNFAPDIDVNNNPNNPVINDRSFGEDRNWVSRLGVQYAKGLQEQRVLASAKHFPGHGDTETDSHYSLPVVKGSRARLDSLELYPFRELIDAGVASVMIAHLNVPALDTTGRVSSLSKTIVTDVLKKELAFDGIVVTDALNMKGVTEGTLPGEVAAKALAAGNDMLLFVEDVPAAISRIREYMASGQISPEQLERSCKKILLAKYWAGLDHYKPIVTERLTEDLNCCESYLMTKKIISEAVVVAKDEDRIIPVQNPELYNTAVLALGSPQVTTFQEMCMNYIRADYYSIDKAEGQNYFDSLYEVLKPYNLLIVSLHNTSRYVSKRLGLTQPQIDFLNRVLQTNKKVIVVNHGNPYILRQFSGLRNVIEAYEDLDEYNRISAQVLFGGIKASGVMPVTVNENFPMGSGEKTAPLERFEYIYPEEEGMNAAVLGMIDTIANEAISKGATPGCQVFAAKDGKVFYQKSFGYQTYENIVPVKNYHLYDLASLTKILATTVAVMHLYDEKKIRLDAHLGDYLPALKGSNKEKLTIQDVMLHQAGLVPFIPFYKQTMEDGRPSAVIYSEQRDSNYCIPVAQNLYMHKQYQHFLWQQIIQSDLKTPGEYVYSDLGFVMLRKVVEQLSGKDFATYLNENIYRPLNLGSMTFNPLDKVNRDWIAQTENDTIFRQQLLNGTVHDPTAAMLGGVSGHAGLFASANDVGVIMQMLLNGGEYGGKRILKEGTVKEFTRKHSKISRRGLGFDKPETDVKKGTPTSRYASPLTFGHTGFTGTCAWADPKTGIVYVFLSNRVHPSAENKKLADMNIRTRIMDVIYEAVQKREIPSPVKTSQ